MPTTTTKLDNPIRGLYLVEPGGMLNLGPAYGKVKVGGLSLEEAQAAVLKQLRRTLKDPQVSVTLNESGGQQQIAGEHLVGPDGTINLGTYGQVYVSGLTIPQAKEAIEKHLTEYLDSPLVSVDVYAYNSKVYYVITQGAGFGDNIQRFPVTGNETVLDAISQVQGLSRLSSKNIWIARPSPTGCDQVLPVQWDEIVPRGRHLHQLPGPAGRPDLHRPRPHDRPGQLRQQNAQSVRTHVRHHPAGRPNRPKPPGLAEYDESIIEQRAC